MEYLLLAPGTLFQQEVISLAQVLIKSWKWLQDPWGLPQREKGGEKGKAKKRKRIWRFTLEARGRSLPSKRWGKEPNHCYPFWDVEKVPDPVPAALFVLFHLLFFTAPWGGYCYYLLQKSCLSFLRLNQSIRCVRPKETVLGTGFT